MKTTVIYHSADFDGIFCREIAKKFLPDAELIGWNFGDAPVPKPLGDVYVLDLPVDRVFGFTFSNKVEDMARILDLFGDATGIKEFNGRLVWIDHHKTSIDTHPKDIPGYRIDGVAACRLAWQWFQMHEHWDVREMHPPYDLPAKEHFVDRNVSEPLAVRLAGEYDIWDKRDPDAELFQHGLRSQELGADMWDILLSGPTKPSDDSKQGLAEVTVAVLLDCGEAIQYAKTNENASIIGNNGFTVQWEGLCLLACNAGQYNSHLFTAGIKPEHEGLLGFCLRSNGQWTVSLYGVPGKPDVDLSAIAKKHGGGGHKQACGFTCGTLPFATHGNS